jgi:hypothetical protein
MSLNRSAKHFILTLEKGKFFLSKAREVVPKRTYEVIEPINPSIEFVWNLEGIGLGESTKRNDRKSYMNQSTEKGYLFKRKAS